MRTSRVVIVAGTVALAALVVFVVPRVVDVNGYRGTIESRLRDRLNRTVDLGEITLRLFPPGVTVEGATIGEDPSLSTGRPFVRVEEVYVGLRLIPLIRGRVELRTLELRAPEIELVRGDAGTWNVASLGTRDTRSSSESAFSLNRLVVTRGRFAVSRLNSRDVAAAGSSDDDNRTVYDGIELEVDVSHDSRKKLLTIGAGTVRLRGTPIALTGTVDYSADRPRLDVHVTASDAEVGDLLSAAHAWGVGPDGATGTGRVNLDVRASGPLDALALTGRGTLEGATLQAPPMAEPVRIVRARLSFDRNTAVLDELSAGLGSTTATGRLAVRTFATPDIDFDLAADRIDAREWQRILAPRREPRPDPAPDRQDSGRNVLARITGNGRLRVGAITFDRLVFEEAQASVRLDGGIVRMDPLTAGLFGGRHRGSVVMDTSVRPAAFTVSSSLEQVDANQLAAAVTSLENIVYGAANATVHMTFAGDRAADLPRSMNGVLSFALDEGRVTTLNLTQEIANIARVALGKPKTERSTRVAALTGDFDVRNGIARTDNLMFSIDDGRLAATGTIDLADQRVDLRIVAVLSDEWLRRAGASRVGNLLTTSLVDERGEFLVPLLIGGTMSAPRVSPDLRRLGELKRRRGTSNRDAAKPREKSRVEHTVEKARDRLRDLLERPKPEEQPAELPPQGPSPRSGSERLFEHPGEVVGRRRARRQLREPLL